MKDNIFKICNDYFVKDNQNFSIVPLQADMQKLNELFKPLEIKYGNYIDNFVKKYDLENKLKQYDENTPLFHIILAIGDFIIQSLKDETMRNYYFDCFKMALENYENLALTITLFDKDLYFELKNYFRNIININEKKMLEIIKEYFKSQSNRIPIESLINTIIFLRDQRQKYEENFEEITLKEIIEKSKEIYPISEEINEKTYEQYFSDFIGKFGIIIEGYIKSCIAVLKYCNNVLKNKKIDNYDYENITIGDIFKTLDTKHKFKDLDYFRLYRNAIQHLNYFLNYEKDWKKGKVIFKTREGIFERNNEELIIDFLRTTQFIYTFNLVVSKIIIDLTYKGEDLFTIVYEKMKPGFRELDEQLKKIPEKSLIELYKKSKENNDPENL